VGDKTIALSFFSSCVLEDAGVPCVPGYHGDNQDPAFLFKKAQEIGDLCSHQDS
jgi:acetyl/propionyl-CoA carboxylase alpha subunit